MIEPLHQYPNYEPATETIRNTWIKLPGVHVSKFPPEYSLTRMEEEIALWIIKHCSNRFTLSGLVYYFESEEDVVQFKLAWL